MPGDEERKRGDPSWQTATDEELVKWRICDLGVKIEGSPVEPRIKQLYEELSGRGIRFHPSCYLTTEWLAPDGVPAIGVPFYLAHPRLQALEQAMMLEVEGGSEKECMQLLRHEAGHALNYAYQLFKRSRWRGLFGPMSAAYNPHEYYLRPYSKQYVIHLRDNYAQAHPDEDFAETFATWITPGLDWRERYREWGALKKVEYVDHLMQEIGPKPPLVARGPLLWPLHKVKATLESHYKRKRREFAEAYPGFYDPILLDLFTRDPGEPAAAFLKRHRKALTPSIARWSHTSRYTVDQLIRRLAQRSREMKLHLRAPEQEMLFRAGICLTSIVVEARERMLQRAEGEN